VLVFVLTIALGVATVAWPCAPAPPVGGHVEIADESAIMLWDATNHTQHFIRRANFKTTVKDFGFLVPTPSRPTLAAAPDSIFDELAKLTAPRVVRKVRWDPVAGIGCVAGAGRMMTASPTAEVHVLEHTRVAGYDAAVLAAKDPDALNRWLGEHGYESRPALTAWLAAYTKTGWNITAFKIAKDENGAPGVATSALRMTFQTDRPFFPYREPDDQRAASAGTTTRRLLRVYLIADGRFAGTLDHGGNWPGATVWAKPLADEDQAKIARELRLPLEGRTSWLTEFEDTSSPRPGTDDLFFSRTADQTQTERAPIVFYDTYYFPDLISLAIGLGLSWFLSTTLIRSIRGRRQATAE
jgi:hypothetical protein